MHKTGKTNESVVNFLAKGGNLTVCFDVVEGVYQHVVQQDLLVLFTKAKKKSNDGFTGRHIALRALEPEDLQFLFQTENNVRFWEMSHTQVPFSKHILKRYLENAHQDIYESKQLRLMIVERECEQPVGMIDIFDFNPRASKSGNRDCHRGNLSGERLCI